MASGARNFKGALGWLLSPDIFEVHGEMLRLAEQRFAVHVEPQDTASRGYEANHIQERLHRIPGYAADHCGFFRIEFRNHQTRNLPRARFDRNRKRTTNAANASI